MPIRRPAPTSTGPPGVGRAAVVLAGHGKRLAESAGPAAEESLRVNPATLAHLLEAARRLQRPDQDCAGHSFALADQVQAPVDSVRPVDVGVAGGAEHRGVALRSAAVAVARRVLLVVGLHLDDPAADAL